MEDQRNGKHYAMKVLCRSAVAGGAIKKQLAAYHHDQKFEDEMKKEAKLLKTMCHPHIVKLVASKLDDETAA